MVPELRQRHRLVWQLWAVLLPIGFVFAIVVLPKKVVQTALIENTIAPLPTISKSKETDWLIANIRSSGNARQQLEILLKKPLDVPATQVFWQNTFLGSLEAKGVQRFLIDSAQAANPPFLLEIRDPINQTVFQKITFER